MNPLAEQHRLIRAAHWIRNPMGQAMPGGSVFAIGREFARLRPAARILILALSAWIGLVSVLTLLAIVAVIVSGTDSSAWFSASASPLPNPNGHSTPSFENIVQRPLFSRNRRIVTAAVPEVTPAPVVANLDRSIVLKGIFMDGATAKAFLVSTENPVGRWVQPNDEIGGWRVAGIRPDQATLEGGNEQLSLPLHVDGGRK